MQFVAARCPVARCRATWAAARQGMPAMRRVSSYVCSYVAFECTNSIALNPVGLDGQEIASVVAQ